MTFAAYLKDHLALLLVALVGPACAALVLAVLGLEPAAVAFVLALAVSTAALAFVLDYLRKRRYYGRLADVVRSLDRPNLAADLVEEPTFAEGRLIHDALVRGCKSMNDQIAAHARASQDYRSYVEAWVHEVKTPIAAARLVAANHPLNDEAARMDREISRIEEYVEQALYYARGTALANDYLIRRTTVRAVVEQALRRNARTLIEAGVSPVLGDLDHTVYTDEKWLVFVLGQIMQNSAKYRKDQEPATLRIDAAERGRGLDAHDVVLTLTDDGIGIPEQDLGRVFEKGFTGANGRTHARSTGMGLYLVRTLCEKMGLTVSLTSREGAGTTVAISFPLDLTRLPGAAD